ncbi:MAG: nucleoside monophosphate kinase [Planctomycetota bacterium]
MTQESQALPSNRYFIEVSGAGIPEIDGLFVPSTEPPKESESGTLSSLGYWNGKLAWDRADGKCERNPSLSYSNSYRSWRIARLDGHLAYHITCEDDLPPTDRPWDVYKMGVEPAPNLKLHFFDPRLPCPAPNVIFVLGGPGAGKGTMCELAELQLGWVHLSTGELLRSEQEKGTDVANTIKQLLAGGNLVPDEIVVRLVRQAMESITRSTGKLNFLIDGFPRCLGNVEQWNKEFGSESGLPKMLYFECPYDVLEKRILGRAKYTGRSDDNLKALKQRFDTFKAETLPIVELFRNQSNCIEIDTGRNRQAVYSEVSQHLAEFTSEETRNQPLTERAEMLLGLRPFPKEKI